MRKKMVALIGMTMMSAMLLLSGCGNVGRSVTVGSGNEKTEKEEKKVTKKSSDDEEETTKKSKKKKNTEETEEEETEKTTKKSSKDSEEETTKKKSKTKTDEQEEETTKKSKDDDSEDKDSKNKGSVSVDAPAGWTKQSADHYSFYIDENAWTGSDIGGTSFAFSHLATAVDGFAENINVLTQDTSVYHLDLKGYTDLSLEQYDQIGYEVLENKEMTINGQEGYYVVTTTEQAGTKCYVVQWFTLLDDTAYIFTFAADESGYEELLDEVMQIYGTVVFE